MLISLVLGTAEVGIGVLLLLRPGLGGYLFSTDFHDRMEARFPRLYSVWGYKVLRQHLVVFTRLFAGILVLIGILSVWSSIAE